MSILVVLQLINNIQARIQIKILIRILAYKECFLKPVATINFRNLREKF